MLSIIIENYLKSIFHLTQNENNRITTTELAKYMNVKSASITDMMQRLEGMDLVDYKKYQGVILTNLGRKRAIDLVRKHRLWEVFLVDKLGFSWDEVHEIAEELEHIKSEQLINKLDAFLGFPVADPHGDPIPDAKGVIKKIEKQLLSEVEINASFHCVGVKDSSTDFLKYLDKQKIALGSVVKVIDKEDFDDTLTVEIDGKRLTISNKIANNLYVQ